MWYTLMQHLNHTIVQVDCTESHITVIIIINFTAVDYIIELEIMLHKYEFCKKITKTFKI